MQNENYGTFTCKICGKVFHQKKQYYGHLGAHRKGITQGVRHPKCKKCGKELIEGANWPMWAVKQRNLICITCKRADNRKSYFRNKEQRKEKRKEELKEKRSVKIKRRKVK